MADLVVNHVGYVDMQQTSGVNPFYNRSSFHNCPELQVAGLCDACQLPNNLNLSMGVERYLAESTLCRLSGLPDLNHTQPKVREALVNWTQWYMDTYSFEGVRIDAVGHIPPVRNGLEELHLHRHDTTTYSSKNFNLHSHPAGFVPPAEQCKRWLHARRGSRGHCGGAGVVVRASQGVGPGGHAKHGLSQLSACVCHAQRLWLGGGQPTQRQPFMQVRSGGWPSPQCICDNA